MATWCRAVQPVELRLRVKLNETNNLIWYSLITQHQQAISYMTPCNNPLAPGSLS